MTVTSQVMIQPAQRKVRTFMLVWLALTLLAGAATFVGIYMATGSIGSGGNGSEIIAESIAEDNDEVAQAVTATRVPLIPPPSGSSASATPTTGTTGISTPQSQNTQAPAASATPAQTATPVPTINPPLVEGELPDYPDFILGAHINNLEGDTLHPMWDALDVANMDWVKVQLRFTRGDDPNAYGWQIQVANTLGYGILYGVVGNREDVLLPGYFDEYAEFVGRLAEIGANGIEVWNEVNLEREWPQGHIDPALYTQLLQKAYTTIKAKNPNTLVISAGLSPTGAEGAFGLDKVWNDDRYYNGLAQAGAAEYMDCVGAHYNEGIISPTLTSGDPRNNDYPTRYLQLQTERAWKPFSDAGQEIPVCYTELGYLTSEGYGPLPSGFAWANDVSLQEQAQWLGTAALLNAQSGKVKMMIIWNLDFTEYGSNDGDDPKAGFALVRVDGGCPACDTLGSLRPYRQ